MEESKEYDAGYQAGYADGHEEALAEIVRCKNCKYVGYDQIGSSIDMSQHVCYGPLDAMYVNLEDYCSWGEPR